MNAWNDLDTTVGANKYMKLIVGDNKIRLISEPVLTYKHFDNEAGITEVYLTKEASASRSKIARRFIMYVLDRADGIIKQAEFGVQIMDQLKGIAMDAEYGVTEPVWPRDITINRKGTTMNDTEYFVKPSPSAVGLTVTEAALVAGLEPLLDVIKKDAMDADKV